MIIISAIVFAVHIAAADVSCGFLGGFVCSDRTACAYDSGRGMNVLYTYAASCGSEGCEYPSSPTSTTDCPYGCSGGTCYTQGESFECWLENPSGEILLKTSAQHGLTENKKDECSVSCYNGNVFNSAACCSELGEYYYKTKIISSGYRNFYPFDNSITAFTAVCLHDNQWDSNYINGHEFYCSGYSCYYCNQTCVKYERMTNPTSVIQTPLRNTEVNRDFVVNVIDTDNGDGVLNCSYRTESNGIETTNGWEPRECSQPGKQANFTVTVGQNGNCRHNGREKCAIFVRSYGRTKASMNNTFIDYKRVLDVFFAYPTSSIMSTENQSMQFINFDINAEDVSGRNKPEDLSCDFRVVSNNTVTKEWSSNSRVCNSAFRVTVGPEKTKYCRHQGINICTVCIRSKDNAYNWYSQEDCRTYSISWEIPISRIIASSPNVPYQYDNFTLYVIDEDRTRLTLPNPSTGYADPKQCSYMVEDNGIQKVSWTGRPCNGPVNITVGSGRNCATEGAGMCVIYVKSKDWVDRESEVRNITFGIGTFYRPPEVLIASPADGSLQRNDFEINYSVTSMSGAYIAVCKYKVESSGAETKAWTTKYCAGPSNTISITVGAGKDCRHPGSRTCKISINATDLNLNSKIKTITLDIEFPSPFSVILSPVGGSLQIGDFTVSVADTPIPNIDLQYCEWKADSGRINASNQYEYTTGWKSRPCNSTFTVRAGPGKDCRHFGENCTISVRASDAYSTGPAASRNFTIRFPSPTSTIVKPAAGMWFNSNFSVDISDTDRSGSGLKSCEYDVSSASYEAGWRDRPCNSNINISVGQAGDCHMLGSFTCRISVRSKDNYDTQGDAYSKDFSIDWTDPESTISLPVNHSWQETSFNVTVADKDNSGMGISRCEYKVNNGAWSVRDCGITIAKPFKVTVGETSMCNIQGGDRCNVCVRAQKPTTGTFGRGDCRTFSIDWSGTVYPGFSNVAAGTTETGVLFSGSPTQTLLIPIFIACDVRSSMEDCKNSYSITKQDCGEGKPCLCGSMTANNCQFSCSDRDDHFYLLQVGMDPNQMAKYKTLKSDVVSYRCPVYNRKLLENITDEFRSRKEEMLIGAYHADYVIRNGGNATYWSDIYRRYMAASVVADNHVKYMELSLTNLSVQKSQEMIARTNTARSDILDILSGGYMLPYIVLEQAVLENKPLNSIASIPIKVTNKGQEYITGSVACSIKDSHNQMHSGFSRCEDIPPGLQTVFVNITVDLPGEWSLDACTAKTSCSYETDRKEMMGTFNVIQPASISIEQSIPKRYVQNNTYAQIIFTASNPDPNDQYVFARCRLTDPLGHYKTYDSNCSYVPGSSTQVFSVDFLANIVGRWSIGKCELNVSSNAYCRPAIALATITGIENITALPENNLSIVSINIATTNITVGSQLKIDIMVRNNRNTDFNAFANCSLVSPNGTTYYISSPLTLIPANNLLTLSPFMTITKDGRWRLDTCQLYKVMSPPTLEDVIIISRIFSVEPIPIEKTIHIVNIPQSQIGGAYVLDVQVNGIDIRLVEYATSKSSSGCVDGDWKVMNYNEIAMLYESVIDTVNLSDSKYYLCARASYGDGSKRSDSTAVNINNYDFSMNPRSSEGTLTTNGTIIYYAALKNTGNLTDAYAISWESEKGWSYSIVVDGSNISSFVLLPGKSANMVITAMPPNRLVGTRDNLVITATSSKSGDSKSVNFTTVVSEVANDPPVIKDIAQIPFGKLNKPIIFSANITDSNNDLLKAYVCMDEKCTSKYCEMTLSNGRYSCSYTPGSKGANNYYILVNDTKTTTTSDFYSFDVFESDYCMTDPDCGTGNICVTNKCMAEPKFECSMSIPCLGTKDKCWCNMGMCKACPSGYECKNYVCTLPETTQRPQCVTTSDCRGTDNSCYCKNNQCVPCADGMVCKSYTCQKPGVDYGTELPEIDMNIIYIIIIMAVGMIIIFIIYKGVIGRHEEEPFKKQGKKQDDENEEYRKYLRKLMKKSGK
jgi:hypothetical protein